MTRSENDRGLQCLNHDIAVSSDTNFREKDLGHSWDQPDNIAPGVKGIQNSIELTLTAHRWQLHS